MSVRMVQQSLPGLPSLMGSRQDGWDGIRVHILEKRKWKGE